MNQTLTEPQWQALASGQQSHLGNVPSRPVLFPGSFNPVHDGHRQMTELAQEVLGRPVHPEISIVNVDKPIVDFESLATRVKDVSPIGSVVLTRAPRFVDKAVLFPEATFVIGADTAIRLDEVRYYENDSVKRDAAIKRIADLGGCFLVFGRQVKSTFHAGETLHLSAALRSICQFVPETRFRIDISSSELRAQ